MGRAYNLTITAAGVGVDPQPISVSGCTVFNSIAELQIAYDPADFDSDQFTLLSPQLSQYSKLNFPPNTILWVRLDPSSGAPASILYVWTQISEASV